MSLSAPRTASKTTTHDPIAVNTYPMIFTRFSFGCRPFEAAGKGLDSVESDAANLSDFSRIVKLIIQRTQFRQYNFETKILAFSL